MRTNKNFNMWENLKYISNIGDKQIIFILNGGIYEYVNHTKDMLITLHDYFNKELEFYDRMANEIHDKYKCMYNHLQTTEKFPTEEDYANADCFKRLELEAKTTELHLEYARCFALSQYVSEIHDKYWKLYKLRGQVEHQLWGVKLK